MCIYFFKIGSMLVYLIDVEVGVLIVWFEIDFFK